MNKCIPNMYKKDIYEIDYDKLKCFGIKCLIFDLDNTLALADEKIVSEKTLNLIKKLEKDFLVVILSNNYKSRIKTFCEPLSIDFVSFAMKPLSKGFKHIYKKYELLKSEMCMIGDQLVTDILGGNLYGIYTILVDPLGKKDLKITSINRFIERMILKRLTRMNLLERGKYYEWR